MSHHNLAPQSTDPTDPTPPGIDPDVLKLAADPLNETGMSDNERHVAANEAQRLAAIDKMRNRKVVEKGGRHYWAAEYPNVFTFDGQLRGSFDWVQRDPLRGLVRSR